MTGPKRVQMTRSRPWRAEHPDAVIVARPSRWGNPYRIVRAPGGYEVRLGPLAMVQGSTYARLQDARAIAVQLYGQHLQHDLLVMPPLLAELRAELRGRDLACWCSLDGPCHADVLLEVVANG